MRLLGLDLSSTTFLSFLSTSILLRQGLSMHCCVFKLGLLNTYDHIPLANAVMSMYIRYGQVHEARAILDSMHEISVVSWSTIIGGYVNTGNVDEAFSMFNIMRTISTINSDFVVFINLIKGCAKRGSLLEASSLHSLIFKCGCENKDPLDNLLLGMYAKCGDLISARKVFDMANAKTVFLWTSIISGGLIKAPGWSQIEISSSVNVFIAGDRSHTQSIDIYKLLEDINLKLAEAGYVPETDTVKH
ncbi:hypothetical protein OIU77_005554 [Salix suchowensis]|uniref:Pentatricopeptide repeat-containing protein n=1 Tax=Salix suchowensis TaxID=1278906 RepID=A0ABQ9APT8_9ROSI|nr:hypothetical protein OIU77_005554 [Salix suchowensis]